MVGGLFKSKLNPNYLVISLAIVFVLYHLWQVFVGTSSFVLAYLPYSTAPVVQHQPTPTPSPTKVAHFIQTGLSSPQQEWPTSVVIPSVGINLGLTGVMEANGTWEVSNTQANFALNTAIPNGVDGNTTLYAHDRAKLFHPIHNLKIGDEIKVIASGRPYVYTVTETKEVGPTDISVFNQTSKPIVTLITCNGWLSDQRYIVIGQLNRTETF